MIQFVFVVLWVKGKRIADTGMELFENVEHFLVSIDEASAASFDLELVWGYARSRFHKLML